MIILYIYYIYNSLIHAYNKINCQVKENNNIKRILKAKISNKKIIVQRLQLGKKNSFFSIITHKEMIIEFTKDLLLEIWILSCRKI